MSDLGETEHVRFTVARHLGKVVDISTNSTSVNHFLAVIKLNRSYHTWLNYAHDLKIFFSAIHKRPDMVDRHDCVTFMQQQKDTGRADTTINRRLAAVSALFHELHLLDPEHFPQNPVSPLQRSVQAPQRNNSLYLKQPARVPDILAKEGMYTFLETLPTWRDRALVLLMCFSCLRVSEVVAIEFAHIECSQRSIYIPAGKGRRPRTTYMDPQTFTVLNRYLDMERGNLFPEEESIFIGLKGRVRGHALTANAVQHLIRYYAHKCSLPYVHPHLFRHTGITLLLENGMAEPALRTMVGHKSPESLEPYKHLSNRFVQHEFQRAATALDPTMAWDVPFF